MTIARDEVIIGAIHKHLHVWFLLSGYITVLADGELKEYKAPCTVLSEPGVKRVIYGNEESVFTNVHKNPTNTEDIKELEEQIVALSYEEYEEYINKK
jgi:quercetin dioxygenase-like cupin family protein